MIFNLGEIENRYDIDFKDYFKDEEGLLAKFVQDGMLEIAEDSITLTDLGRNFSNLTCRIFDKYVRSDQYPNDFFNAPKVLL